MTTTQTPVDSHLMLVRKLMSLSHPIDKFEAAEVFAEVEASARALAAIPAQADCAGGSPCTECPDKKQCQRGCLKQVEFISQEHHDRAGWKAECDAVDALLLGLGIDPERCRTEGGSLNVGRALSLIKDGCATPPAAPAQDAQGDEQSAFEEWLARTCPSGDVTEVQRQWEASSEYADCAALRASSPAEPLSEEKIVEMMAICNDQFDLVREVERHYFGSHA